jgi:hypothetical protein
MNRDERAIFIEDLPYMLSTKFQFIWESGFREDFFRNQPIRKKNGLWLFSKKSSPLKPLGQMNQNLVGSILGRSSLKIAHSRMACGGHVC